MAALDHYPKRALSPHPPLVIHFFAILFSTICIPLSIVYATQIHAAPTAAYINTTWAASGAGTLYYLPAPLTLLLSVTHMCLYHRVRIPIAYSLAVACTLCAGWIVVLVFWTQCHNDLWGTLTYEDTICWQRNLVSGYRGQEYLGVNDRLAYASMAMGVLLILLFCLESIGAGVELRRGRKNGVWRYRVADKGTGKTGGRGRTRGAGGGYADGGFWAGGGGGDGGGGGGDGGGGGGDGGGC